MTERQKKMQAAAVLKLAHAAQLALHMLKDKVTPEEIAANYNGANVEEELLNALLLWRIAFDGEPCTVCNEPMDKLLQMGQAHDGWVCQECNLMHGLDGSPIARVF